VTTVRPLILAAAALAALSMTACASKPRPLPTASAGPDQTRASGLEELDERRLTPGVSGSGLEGPAQMLPGGAALQALFASDAGDRVFFELDSRELSAEARNVLVKQAEWLKARPQVRIIVAGNCDERGAREYNFALGAERADAAKSFLIGRGVAADRITTVSYGKERPMDQGADEASGSRNRNAQSVILDLGPA
jgi:peptidoglycan-associated lipoprotein